MRDRLRAAPAWAWVAALVLASWCVRFLFARHMVGPWIMIDEIVYSELAKSFAATGHFAVREQPTTGYGYVYPILISPAYALFRSIPTVYTGIKVINSLLMSLTAVPAYLLARRVVSQRGALAVALLTVAVPSTFYAGVVMTENAFYPIFVLLALALVAALERPRALTVVLFLAALLVAYETRAQAIAVLPAALTAPLVAAALSRRRADVTRQWLLYAVVVGLGLVAVLAEVARGRSITSLLGAYSAATSSTYRPGPVAHWFLWHMAELTFSVGVLPVLAVVLLAARGAALSGPERALVAATVSLVLWVGIEVAAFATQPAVLRIEERNLFYVAPLLFACLVLWIERGALRPRVVTPVAVVAVAALAAGVPYGSFFRTDATSDTFSVLTLWSVALWLHVHAQDMRWVVGGAALVFLLAAALVPRRFAALLLVVPFGLALLAIQPVDSRMQRASVGAVFQGITRPDRDWITAIVGSSDPTKVAVVWTGATDRLTVNENEFFNRDVGAVYTTSGPVPGGLAQTPISLDRATGRYEAAGDPVDVADALVDTTLPFAGRQIGADPKKGLRLLRVDGPLRLRYTTSGLYPDTWSTRHVTFRRYACTPATLTVTLSSDVHLYRTPQRVQAAVEGAPVAAVASVPPDATVTMRIPLRSACVVRFLIPRTKSPGPSDRRRLGVHFDGFALS